MAVGFDNRSLRDHDEQTALTMHQDAAACTSITPELRLSLVEVVGAAGVVEGEDAQAPYLLDWRKRGSGRAALVLRPGNTGEVAQVMALCHAAKLPVVPQGGNTGLVGASVPDAGGGQLLLSLSRMNRVRALDAVDFTLTAEAGCVLVELQRAAAAKDLLFPLSLAAEGSCQLGGNLSTNAGGTAVLRYGNARDLVLGLEVVLPDGRIWNGLRRLRKDNTGYALKHLFIGAEGTLGVITAAVLKLFPQPRGRVTAMVAVTSADAALALLACLRVATGDAVSAFEYINRVSLEAALYDVAGNRDPFAERHQHYALVEVAGGATAGELRAALESVLGESVDSGDVQDAVIADSGAQAATLWRLRETIPEGSRARGLTIPHDISVPVSAMPEFLGRAEPAMRAYLPGVVVYAFGHVGDGNVHFNLGAPAGMTQAEFDRHATAVNELVYEVAASLDGSFSAEHGVGRYKRAQLQRYRGGVELELMRTVKRALDPDGIMNPGVIV